MATHYSSLAWKIPKTEEPGGLQSMGCKELDTTERLTMHTGYQTIMVIFIILQVASGNCYCPSFKRF